LRRKRLSQIGHSTTYVRPLDADVVLRGRGEADGRRVVGGADRGPPDENSIA